MPGNIKAQNKFIPKRSINLKGVTQNTAIADVLLLVSIVTLASSLAVAAGMYIYSTYNDNAIKNAKNSLNIASQKFQELTIKDFQTLSKQLEAGDRILNNHLAVSEIFKALEESTLKSVQYTKFIYSVKSPEEITVQLEGNALSVNALAWQSKVLGGQKRIFKNAIFSNLDLKDGKPSFSVDMSINPDAVKFTNVAVYKLQNSSGDTNTKANSDSVGSVNNPDVFDAPQVDNSSVNASSSQSGINNQLNASDLNSLDQTLNNLDVPNNNEFGI